MEFIRNIVFVLLVPVITCGQTVHVDSNRIVYKGIEKVSGVSKDELYARAKSALLSNTNSATQTIISDDVDKGMITAKGSIRLASPYHIIKTVEYILELSVEDGAYKYRIDSVYMKQAERGGATKKMSSEELLKGMDINGPASAIAEGQLNEIDMDFQKLLDLVKADMKASSAVKIRSN